MVWKCGLVVWKCGGGGKEGEEGAEEFKEAVGCEKHEVTFRLPLPLRLGLRALPHMHAFTSVAAESCCNKDVDNVLVEGNEHIVELRQMGMVLGCRTEGQPSE